MKIFSNRKQTKNELLSALAVLDGLLSQRVGVKSQVKYSLDLTGVFQLEKGIGYHCTLSLSIDGGTAAKSAFYEHDLFLHENNVDDQLNSCLLAVQEQLSIAGL